MISCIDVLLPPSLEDPGLVFLVWLSGKNGRAVDGNDLSIDLPSTVMRFIVQAALILGAEAHRGTLEVRLWVDPKVKLWW